jgi:hypothetical protein
LPRLYNWQDGRGPASLTVCGAAAVLMSPAMAADGC